jgi:uroporphyrinogen-III synthase
MRLLVTRPVEEAARTAGRLVSLGHEPLIAPVMEVAPTGAALPDGPFDLVIATSARALQNVGPMAAPMACVGEKTAAAARKAGFAVVAVAPDADRLADLLEASTPKTALYLAGRERRPDLETFFHAAGWPVEIVEVYASRPVATWPGDIAAALAAGVVDGILHYSPRSAELALALMGEARGRLAHFCLSPAVAQACVRQDVAAERIFVASQPTEDALMSLVEGRRAS